MEEALPQGWMRQTDPATNVAFYLNAAKSISQWEKPEDELAAAAPVDLAAAASKAAVVLAPVVVKTEAESAATHQGEQPAPLLGGILDLAKNVGEKIR